MQGGELAGDLHDSPRMGAVRLLLVNDDDDGLYLIERSLGRIFPDAEILQAKSGAEALEILAGTPVDGIVTDNQMPMMTGLEMAQRIRETGSTIPIVMLSGRPQLKPEALAAGVTVFHPASEWSSVGSALRQCLPE